MKMNVFSPPEETYDFIRIMNVLNTCGDGFGFSDEKIVQACQIVLGLLRNGGFMLVGRTHRVDGGFETNATLFQSHDDQLEKRQVLARAPKSIV